MVIPPSSPGRLSFELSKFIYAVDCLITFSLSSMHIIIYIAVVAERYESCVSFDDYLYKCFPPISGKERYVSATFISLYR
jgi:hypothetical protein